MDMKINFKLVKELRTKANWSQDELATITGLSLRTIQRVENDGSSSLETRKAIASAFDISANDLDISKQTHEKFYRVGFGMVLFWIGIAWLFDLGLGIGLAGVGIVYIVRQIGRYFIQKKPVLWEHVAIGVVILAVGVGTLIGVSLNLSAVCLLLVGCILIFGGRQNKST